MSRTPRSLIALLAVVVGSAGLVSQPDVALAAPTTCGGTVFHDYDHDGERAEDYSHVSAAYTGVEDEGVAGIAVRVTTADGGTISATTDANGDWVVNLDTNDFPIRVDFSGLPAGWGGTPKGVDAQGLTQHIATDADCGVAGVASAGVAAPDSYCETRPDLATSCFLFGDVAGHDDLAAVVTLIDGAVDNGGTSGTGWQDDPYTTVATLGQVGTVYGLDNWPVDESIFVASFVKRHAQLGPSGNPTTIYRIQADGTVGEWYTTDATAVDPHSGATDGWRSDFDTFDDVGRQGLGDIEISPDGQTLYTVDLGRRELVAIPINTDGTPDTSAVVRTAITSASLGLTSCPNSDVRPFALGWDGDTLLVGATCSAESTVPANPGSVDVNNVVPFGDPTELSAHVYSFDGSFTLVTDVPLPSGSRGSQNGQYPPQANSSQTQTDWRPWVTEAPFAHNFSGWPAGASAYAQPLLSDIELDGDDLIIGFIDLWGHQMGPNTPYMNGGTQYQMSEPMSAGDIVRAVSDGAGGYTFPNDGQDYFYDGDGYLASHDETALGASVQIPGRPYVIGNSFDPVELNNTWQSGGIEWFANETIGTETAGDHIRGYRLYDGRADLDTGTFEKAAGIGDLQALCSSAPIEVGDFVWFDADMDGLAGPGETPMAGVVVELVDDGGTVIATDTTDSSGLYLFDESISGFHRNGDYAIRVAQSNYNTGGVFASGGAHEGRGVPTLANQGSDDENDSDGVPVSGLPSISFTATNTDHSMDFGFVAAVYDLALTKVFTSDSSADGNSTDGVIRNGDDVVFTINVENQGTIPANSFTVTDHIPAGFTLNAAASTGWNAGAGNTATFDGGPLVPGANTDIAITLTASGAVTGASVNIAEISADDGADADSTPNPDPTDDNQPANPGDPTDDVTDNSNGPGGADEDDHDIAGVTVENYDLALSQIYTSDDSGAATDGVIEAGANVVFTITVTNQGSIDANTFDVINYIPAGFTIDDTLPANAGWTDNLNGTATFTGGPLTAGGSTNITITLTANGAADGNFVNWAEISADDGVDGDSTPDSDQSNDNQPSGPGAPTDNVIDNTADASGDPDEDDHDPAGVSLVAYDLALITEFGSDTFGDTTDGVIQNGSDVTFNITVTNQGTIDATTFTVTDYLPAGFELNTTASPAWTDNGDGTASIDRGPLTAGSSDVIPITLTAVGASAGDLVNWAEICADDGDDGDSTPNTDQADDNQPTGPGEPTDNVIDNTPDASGDPDEDDHDPAGVTVQSYDLALSQVYTSDTFGNATDGVVENGTDVVFTITVTNQGSVDAAAFEVTDYLPTGFDLNTGASTGWTDNADGTATFTGGPLASGANTDITITLTANGAADGNFVNWAEISADDGVDGDSTPDSDQSNDNQPSGPGAPTDNVIDNTADASGDPDEDDHDPAGVTVGSFDLALTKVYTSDTSADGNSTDGQIQAGDDVVFTINVENQGSIDAATFTVTDHIPAGFSLNATASTGWTAGAGNTATFTGGPLAAGANIDISITLTASGAATGDSVNIAEISSDDGNDTDSSPDGDPTDDNQPAAPGDPTDDVTDGTAGPGGADEDDHDIAGITVTSYDLALIIGYGSDTFGDDTDGVIETGSDVAFAIEVRNQGTLPSGDYTVTAYLPTGFSLSADPTNAGWTPGSGNTASIDLSGLPSGDFFQFPITVTATGAPDGENVIWAEISNDDGFDADSTPDDDRTNDNQPTGPGQPTDNVTDNSAGPGGADEDDHDPAGVTVRSYDLALTKVYTSDTFGAATDGVIQNGSDAVFTITVTNQGSFDAGSFEVTDYLPAGFTIDDSLPANAGWTDNGDGTATFAGGPLSAGSSVNIPITVRAATAPRGDLVNWAEISADDGNDGDSTADTDPDNDNQPTGPGEPTDGVIDGTDGDEDDHDPAGITVANYDLALSQVYTSDVFNDTGDAVITEGDDVTFTITVTNQGTIDATSFEVTDYLPAGFDLNTTASPGWTDNNDGTATFTNGALAAGSSVDITITLTATTATDGDYVNWAEISTDDGFDIDSTPDTDQGNDNQPAGPGAPTDNVVDGTDSDEDDHDPASVTVGSVDFALTKVYTSDNFGDTTDGVIAAGSEVTFTITVTNQGTVASDATIVDYVPAGFTGALASNTITDLAPGDSQSFMITLTADANLADGDYVNIAEIDSTVGTDIDSTPDSDAGNDNQPANPGDPTDDATDNSAGPGGADEDDHDIAGVSVASYDLALTIALTGDDFGDISDAVIQNGSRAFFAINVENQGTIDAANFEVTNYLPAGFTIDTTDPANAGWVDNADGTATYAYSGPAITPGSNTIIVIVLTADSAADGENVTWAEISSDDGDDVDSSPDADQGNDNQPTGPGEPTDGVTDNSAGPGGADEDDHDPAGITVASYDLALTKQFTSDTFGDTTDAIVENGSDATFTITVFNQGTQTANSVEITDHIPAGFVLDDAAWTPGAGNTATTTVGPIAPGASVAVDITISADTAANGSAVNWAEISADDGDDGDSTPDSDRTNDNQPAAPGDPTDGVTDNTVDASGDADEDDHDPAGITVANYDLALSQVYTSDTHNGTTDGVVENGADVTFTITVENQGTVDAGSFTVVDYIPAGLSLNTTASPGWTDNGDGTATYTGGPLAAGVSEDITITFDVDGAPAGPIVNWAEIATDDGNDTDSTPDTDQTNDNQPANVGDATDDVTDNSAGPGGADEDDHDPAGVNVEVYDLALTKQYTSDDFGNTTDGEIQPSAEVVYTITVTNQGSVDATAFDVTDYFPTGFTIDTTDPSNAGWTDNGNSTATITAGPLAAGDSTDITITLIAGTVTPGSYTNWAEISADDGNDIDSTADTDQANDNQPSSAGDPTDGVIDGTVDGAGNPDEDDHDPAAVGVSNFDLALSKQYTSDDFGDTTDGVIQDGSNVTFAVNVVNQGTIDATTFEVTDYLPAGFDLNTAASPGWTDNADGTASFTGGPLTAGDSLQIPITLTANGAADGVTVNWAEISSDDGFDIDSTPDDDRTNDNQPAAPGDPTDDATNNAPNGSGNPDEDDHDLAGFTVASYDLALVQVFTSDTHNDGTDRVVEPGTDATFTITVTNQGSIDAPTFEVTDYLPAGFDLNTAASPGWTDNADGTATFTGGLLAAGASTDIAITLTATGAAVAGDFVNWAEISADSGDDVDSTPDTDQGNDNQPANVGDATDDVIDNTAGPGGADEDDHDPAGVSVEVYDLALIKVYTSDTSADGNTTDGLLQIGDDVTFTITVTNQGTVDANTFTVTDAAPVGFVLNTAASPGWTDNADGTASRTAGPLTAGASIDLPVTFTVNASGAGELSNRAEITADDGNDVDSITDPDPTNDNQPAMPGDPTDDVVDGSTDASGDPDEDDHDIAGITVDAYDLALTKVYTSDASADGNSTDGVIVAGDDVTFTIEVFNQGTADAADVEVTDYIPAGFVLNDAAWTPAPGNTATTVVPAVAAGTSETVTITLTASGASTGTSVNIAEISSDDGTDVDSTPNADPDDDGTPADNVTDNSPSVDGNPDEDDHDIAEITVGADFDLALVKSLDASATTLPVVPGQTVTFTLTVINQGTTPADGISLIDYVDTAQWLGFDPALNPAGTTAGGASLSYVWSAAGTDGSVTISGTLAGGQSVAVPVTLTIASGADLSALQNVAEISASTPVNPDGSPMPGVTDNDSTPDTSDGDTVVDDVTDNTGGDEDDHDIARVTAPRFSLGNQVWLDVNNNGVVDGTEAGIAGVVIDLFADTDADGNPDDRNADGAITDADALVITATNADGLYLFTDLDAGNYIAGISDQGDRGEPLFGLLSSDTTVTDGNSGVDNDDNGTPCLCADGYIYSGSVTLGDGEPTGETPDNDTVTADPNENLTVDFGFWQPNFDLALRKQLRNGTNTAAVKPGDLVTFTLTIFNQGNVPATDLALIDYVPAGLTLADSDWTAAPAGATITVPGTVPVGGSTSVDITMRVNSGASGTIDNNAEITSATAVSSAGAPLVLPDNSPLPDVDSIADAVNVETPVDDVVDNSNGDEDDHDIARVTITPPRPQLALTGMSSDTLTAIGYYALTIGGAFVFLAKRNEEDEVVVG